MQHETNIPKILHRKLSELSKQEGVSLNTLTITLLAEGLGLLKDIQMLNAVGGFYSDLNAFVACCVP